MDGGLASRGAMIAIASRDGATLRGRWLRLRWSQSLAGQPVRLVARLTRRDETENHILAAAALGRGAWTWRAPPDLERLDILAPEGAQAGLRIDALGPISWASVLRGVLVRRPGLLPTVLWPGTTERGRNVTVHEAFDLAAPDDFARYAGERRRPFEPEGLDAPLLAAAARGPRLGFVIPVEDVAEVGPLSHSLAAFSAQHDPAFRLRVIAPEPFGASLRRANLDDRLEIVAMPEGMTGEAASLAAAASMKADFVGRLLPGDEPVQEAVQSLRAFLAEPGDIDLVYADSSLRTESGERALLKPDWSAIFQSGCDYVGRPSLVRRENLTGDETSWRELPARLLARHGSAQVGHLKRVLVRLATPPSDRSLPRAEVAAASGPGGTQNGLPPFEASLRGAPQKGGGAGRSPRATIIVPTRDRVELLRRLGASLFAKNPEGFDLIVVDNGSEDVAALAYLAELDARPDTRVLRRPGPFNFSILVNAGVEAATGEVVVLLNNDCEIVEADWLARLVAWASMPGVGAVGAKLLYADGTLQHAGVALGLGGEAGHRDRKLSRDHAGNLGRLTVPHEVAAVTAACLAVRREAYRSIGGFDEALPVAFNDIDFCLRLRACGSINILDPGAVVVHAESASRGRDDGPRRARFLREAAAFRQRWQDVLLDDPYFHPMLTTFRFYDRLG